LQHAIKRPRKPENVALLRGTGTGDQGEGGQMTPEIYMGSNMVF